MNKVLTYLACPYSHDDPEVRRRRFELATEYAARLVSTGAAVFSPITHGHPIFLRGAGTMEIAAWATLSEVAIANSARFIVLRLEGWERSNGIKAELETAARFGLKTTFVDYCGRCELFLGPRVVHKCKGVERCPGCGHMPHKAGMCLNMASDNDCDCRVSSIFEFTEDDARELTALREKLSHYGEGSQSPPAADLKRLLELEELERSHNAD